jgi:hypothetical protein
MFLLSRLAKTVSITLMTSLSITLYFNKHNFPGELFSQIEDTVNQLRIHCAVGDGDVLFFKRYYEKL